jgi:hypothetical protein
VTNHICFQEGAKESIRLKCLNDPRLGGRTTLKEKGRGYAPGGIRATKLIYVGRRDRVRCNNRC